MNNGLKSFAFHVDDVAVQPATTAIRLAANTARGSGGGAIAETPESAARGHLARALGLTELPELTAPTANGQLCEFRILGTEAQPLTKTTTVKFRQTFHKVPVYGSLVTVEL